MVMNIEKIFALYGDGESKQLNFINNSRGDDDLRHTYIVKYPGGLKIAVKVSNNSFTTPDRINGWAQLCGHYDNLGIYCPQIMQNKEGNYYTEVDGYIVYAEEFMKYKIADSNGRTPESNKYKKKMYESIGLVAANPAPLVPWKTAYCLYDKFADSDLYDENYECAFEFYKFFKDNFHELNERTEKIWILYNRKREAFEQEYRALPKAVFQGDLNSSNILLTRSGNFKGLIDFNLSGTETILNYVFCECCQSLEDEDKISTLLDIDELKLRDEKTVRNLAYVSKHYKFTDAEKAAFNSYYNIVMPFRWPYHCFFMKLLRGDGRHYANDVIEWVEYQLTRSDVSGQLP